MQGPWQAGPPPCEVASVSCLRASPAQPEMGKQVPYPPPSSLCPFPAAPDGVARGPDALSLLEYPETRSQFIDELMEVRVQGVWLWGDLHLPVGMKGT